MKKKIVFITSALITMCMVSVPGITTYAAGISTRESKTVGIETCFGVQENISEGGLPGKIEPKGILTTKYRVSVKKATMRSGPGTSYSSLGTLYKNDVVWVRSISDGWAKFKVNSKWHYISESCIKKATY